MDKRIYLLCKDYVQTFELLYIIMEFNLENHERLMLFRLSQERLSTLERELFDTVVEKEM